MKSAGSRDPFLPRGPGPRLPLLLGIVPLLLFLPSFLLFAVEDQSLEDVLLFADHLFQEGDFLRAAEEYRRYLFFAESKSGGGSAEMLLKIGECYQCAGFHLQGLPYFRRVLEESDEPRLMEDAAYEIAYSRTLLRDHAGALEVIDAAGGGESSVKMLVLWSVNSMYLGRWEAASAVLDPTPPDPPAVWRLKDLAERGAAARRRKPFVAGLLSTFIPGLGKAYAGEIADGVFSLASVGLFSALAVLRFQAAGIGSIGGWVYAALGTIFHLGNIYGSAASAVRYNARLEEALLIDAAGLLPSCRE